MTYQNLLNLVKTGSLKAEPADRREFAGLLRSGKIRLADAQMTGLSPESRFDLAYNAAHALALAALRSKGFPVILTSCTFLIVPSYIIILVFFPRHLPLPDRKSVV